MSPGIKSSHFTNGKIFQHFKQGIGAILESGASNEAIGECFLQTDNAGVLHPVGFYSRKLAKAEKNFKIYDKEMLAIVACLTEQRVYLEGAQPPTEVYTDHFNLTYFLTTKALICNKRGGQRSWEATISGLCTGQGALT